MERATLSSCAKGTAMEDARNHEAECATPRVGDGFGTRCPGSVNGGAGTLHTPVLETPASGPRAGVRPRVTNGGGGKACNRDDNAENGEEEVVANILEDCGIGDGVAADNDVRTEAATDKTSSGVGTLPTPVLEALVVGASAGVRPRAAGGKAGIRNNDDEDWCGRRKDPSTPGPETSAVALKCQHETGEMGGGREEVRPGASTYEDEDARPGTGTYERTDGEVGSGKGRVGNGPDRKTARKKNRARAGEPGPNRRKPGRPIGRIRLRLRWEPVSARWRPTGHDGYGSGEERNREGPSTPILETSAVADQHETGETAGGGEESEADAKSETGSDIRCEKADERVQDGEPKSERATETRGEETDAEVGTTVREGRTTKHALRPVEGQRTGMLPEERQRVTGDDGPVEPLRGKYGMEDGTAKDPSTGRTSLRRGEREEGPKPTVHEGGTVKSRGRRTNGESGRRCAENNGLRAGKRKRDFPDDVRGQAGQEDTDTEVGVMVRSTAKEHGKRRKGEERVMGSPKDQRNNAHLEGNIDVRGEPTGGKRKAERVGTPRCSACGGDRAKGGTYAAHKGRNPACDRRSRERIRRTYTADKARETGSTTTFGRIGQRRRRARRIWRIGWRRRFGDEHRIWRIGWSWWFEETRWTWWIGWDRMEPTDRGRQGAGEEVGCRTAEDRNSLTFFLLAHTGGCAVWWGRMS